MPKQEISWKRDIVILIVLQVALALSCLKTVPRFYLDEAWEASLGHSLAYEGRLRHGIIEGWGGMHIHFVQNQVVLPWLCATVYRLAGFGISTSRMASVIMSVIAIVSIYGVMRRWFGHNQAFLMGLATILHPWFFEISRRVRPEIYYLALSMAALYCMVRSLDSNSRRTALFAGILSGLTGLAHPTGFILVLAIAAAVLIWLRTKTIWRLVLWAWLGLVIAILPYALYVLWSIQDPQVSFLEQIASAHPHRARMLAGEIARWKHFLQWPKGVPLAIILIACWLFGWYRSTHYDKVLVTIISIFSIILPFATVNNTSRYLVAISPLFCALLVRMIWRIMSERISTVHRWLNYHFIAGICIAGIYLMMSIVAISLMFYRLHGADLYKLLDRVASVVTQQDRVYGDMIFWMEHERFRYGPFPIEFRNGTLQQNVEMVRKYRFDYAVRMAWSWASSHGIASPPADMPDFNPSSTMDQVCKQFGNKIDEFRDPYFGPVEVYKLNWDNNSNSTNKKGTGSQN